MTQPPQASPSAFLAAAERLAPDLELIERVMREQLGSASALVGALGEHVLEAGRGGGKIEGREQGIAALEAAEGQHRSGGGEKFDVPRDQQLLLATPGEQPPEAVQRGCRITLLRGHRQREMLRRHRQPRRAAGETPAVVRIPGHGRATPIASLECGPERDAVGIAQ